MSQCTGQRVRLFLGALKQMPVLWALTWKINLPASIKHGLGGFFKSMLSFLLVERERERERETEGGRGRDGSLCQALK